MVQNSRICNLLFFLISVNQDNVLSLFFFKWQKNELKNQGCKVLLERVKIKYIWFLPGYMILGYIKNWLVFQLWKEILCWKRKSGKVMRMEVKIQKKLEQHGKDDDKWNSIEILVRLFFSLLIINFFFAFSKILEIDNWKGITKKKEVKLLLLFLWWKFSLIKFQRIIKKNDDQKRQKINFSLYRLIDSILSYNFCYARLKLFKVQTNWRWFNCGKSWKLILYKNYHFHFATFKLSW